jgi:hypothetical protein
VSPLGHFFTIPTPHLNAVTSKPSVPAIAKTDGWLINGVQVKTMLPAPDHGF